MGCQFSVYTICCDGCKIFIIEVYNTGIRLPVIINIDCYRYGVYIYTSITIQS